VQGSRERQRQPRGRIDTSEKNVGQPISELVSTIESLESNRSAQAPQAERSLGKILIQTWTIVEASFAHGMVTAEPDWFTTTVAGFAFKTSLTRALVSPGNLRIS
jgi:hypothetical protein